MATVADVMQMLGEKEGLLVVLSPTQTIESAMEVLNENRILSAPLVNSAGRFLGMIDVHDMLDLVVEAHEKGEGVEKWALIMQNTLDKCSPRTKNKDISFLAKGPGTSKPIAEAVATKFLPGNVHRIAISDCDGHPLVMFSQSDVLRYLHLQPAQIGPKADLTLAQLGMAKRQVVTMSSESAAIDGLVLMHNKNVRVLPVLNEQGQLVAQLSTASLRGLCTKHLDYLRKPVLEFLSSPVIVRKEGQSPLPLRVKAEDTLRKCIEQLCAAAAHECFVVDAAGRVDSIVTLTDILRLIWG